MKQFKDRFVKKDNKTFWFSSSSPLIQNSLYGVTPKDKRDIDEKLKGQKYFLDHNYININDSKFIPLSDISMTANHTPDLYHAEMFNRVKTLQDYAKGLGYDTPVFITLTPPSYLKPLKTIKLKSKLFKVVDNPKFIGFENYVDNTREYNSYYWTKFLRQGLFQELKNKFGERLIYMRTCEPQLDGSLHTHIMAFIPNKYKDRFVKLINGYFHTQTDVKTDFDNTQGIIGYILKYILKSFTHKDTNNLDSVGYWYVKHQIRRFTTSRTLVPMGIYRKIRQKDDYRNLLEMTKYYKTGRIQIEVFYDSNKLDTRAHSTINSLDYRIASITVIVNDYLETHFDLVYEKNFNVSLYVVDPQSKTNKIPTAISINNAKNSLKTILKTIVPVEYDGIQYALIDNELKKMVIVPSRMSDFKLYQYYQSLDPDSKSIDLKHFAVTQNECIKRGLINEKIQSINDFNLKIGA